MSRVRRRRLPKALAAIAAVGLLVGLVAAPDAEVTEAQWGDAEYVESAEISASQLHPPMLISAECRSPLVYNTPYRVRWRWPDENQRFDLSDANIIWLADGVPMSQQPTTVHESGDTYLTSFSGNLLELLIGTLLGGTVEVEARATLAPTSLSDWESDGVRATGAWTLAGFPVDSRCTP